MNLTHDERDALCALLAEKGPDAPTLCEGWTTRDLAAHLVLRERRPTAALGIVLPPLAGHTASVQRKIAESHSYHELIEMIRSGPPRLSAYGIPGVDERANAVEYYTHHEDVRRGSPGWDVRQLGPAMDDMLWRRLRMAGLLLCKAPCGVVLRREGGTQQVTAKSGTPAVTVSGTPGELTLWVLGRTTAAQVRLDGDKDALARLREATWGL